MPTIDFDLVVEPALIGINRAYVFMGLGVNAALSPDHSEYRLPARSHLKLFPDNLDGAKIDELKREFSIWIIANGLRELIESWDICIDRLHQVALSAEHWQRSQGSGTVDPKPYEKRANAFPKLGTSEKFALLKEEFGMSIAFQSELESIKKARNCLTHRLGLVGEKDVGSGDSLTVSWRTPELFGYEKDGSEFVPSLESVPITFPENSPVNHRNAVRTKTVQLGKRLEFSPAEVKEICFMFRMAVDQTRETFIEFVTRMGGTVNGSPANPGPEAKAENPGLKCKEAQGEAS